ncbi:peroxisomal succinyl-coenzyme A thioesterase-like [Protopterus annectens]|uniref:peroxisomal succinyl-coenzyme A thioesterase-like n=1 Tax=Protopterus annectens TaxID=7888 RepID=UPI001CFC351B|nr:peroxisomal succinyl-coenzyme A thioesterase-like [Protopterus annectens]
MIPLPYEPSQEVEVEKIRCPVLLISGEDDQAFPSVEASHYIEKKMKEAGNSHLLSRICYPGAGHAIQPPFTPLCRLLYYSFPGFKERVWTLFGGEEKAHAAAQVDAWKQILIFLKQHLVLS